MTYTWYIALPSGGQQGPLDTNELKEAASAGRLQASTLVWKEGMSDWAPASETEVAPLLAPAPPPLPRLGGAGTLHASPPMTSTRLLDAKAGTGPAPHKGFTDAISNGFANYATFRGRASRSEYWYWTLFVMLVSLGAGIVEGAMGVGPDEAGIVSVLLSLALILPNLAVSCRRLHDINRSGWWLLMVLLPIIGWIVLFVFYCTKPTMAPTKYD